MGTALAGVSQNRPTTAHFCTATARVAVLSRHRALPQGRPGSKDGVSSSVTSQTRFNMPAAGPVRDGGSSSSSFDEAVEPLLPTTISSDEPDDVEPEKPSLWSQLTLYKV
jgi:hypothetical protein